MCAGFPTCVAPAAGAASWYGPSSIGERRRALLRLASQLYGRGRANPTAVHSRLRHRRLRGRRRGAPAVLQRAASRPRPGLRRDRAPRAGSQERAAGHPQPLDDDAGGAGGRPRECRWSPTTSTSSRPIASSRSPTRSVGASPFDQPRGQRTAIDLFFRSLAAAHGDGFAVLLSGTGSDGAIGARAVKERGGLVLVQDPSEAVHSGMPRAAIATGVADLVLPVRELAARLAELARNKQLIGCPCVRASEGAEVAAGGRGEGAQGRPRRAAEAHGPRFLEVQAQHRPAPAVPAHAARPSADRSPTT